MRHKVMRLYMPSVAVIGVLTILSLPLAAQHNSDADTVHTLELKWSESYLNRQVETLSSLMADDFVITIEDGSTYGKTGYISHAAAPSLHVEVAEMTDVRVRMHGNTAVVTGAYHERGQDNGKPYEDHDRFTDVWLKNGGKWQVIASHYSLPVK
jgi:ketosteroid isomerase-like protein